MRVIDMADISEQMQNQTDFVLRCEEVFHDKISAACAAILAEYPKKRVVCLTGPSGSGKTTTAMRLREYLENLGLPVSMLSMDNFFIPAAERTGEAKDDLESPLGVNSELLHNCIQALYEGKTVMTPVYDFVNQTTGSWTEMKGSRDGIIIAEGIHMLNPIIFDSLRAEATGVYVAPRTRVITPADRIVKPEEVRVARRLIRDYNNRGYSLARTVERAQSVDRGEQRFIAPNKPNASVHIDTFHDYELCVLAGYLRKIPTFREELTPEFTDAHGLSVLMEVVNSIPPLETPFVPKDSLVREFVGGSRFAY